MYLENAYSLYRLSLLLTFFVIIIYNRGLVKSFNIKKCLRINAMIALKVIGKCP